MSKYRIICYHKPGFYKYYRVQERKLLFFWINQSRLYDYIEQAQSWIKDQSAVETKSVVHEE